jgi:hypothetical protein
MSPPVATKPPAARCAECGRGGRHAGRLAAPALCALAAREVADGEGLADETVPQLVLLRRELEAALATVDRWIEYRAAAWMAAAPEEEAEQ